MLEEDLNCQVSLNSVQCWWYSCVVEVVVMLVVIGYGEVSWLDFMLYTAQRWMEIMTPETKHYGVVCKDSVHGMIVYWKKMFLLWSLTLKFVTARPECPLRTLQSDNKRSLLSFKGNLKKLAFSGSSDAYTETNTKA